MGFRPTMGSCDIYYSRKEGEFWSFPLNVGQNINSGAWDSQPAISADGNTIYFVSRRRGGYGGTDIYYSHKDSLGQWTKAKNMGPTINTFGNEMAPYIHADGKTLYFSSDGHVGMGKMDLFFTKKSKTGEWSKPENLGIL